MNVLDFQKLVKSEKTAMHYVLTRCGMTAGFCCPACTSAKLYEVESGKRRRCARCGHTFNPFAGRYLNGVKLTAQEWLWLIKLFELEMPATVIADETGISYPTVLKAIDTIRCAITDSRRAGPATGAVCEAMQQLAAIEESTVDDTVSHHIRFGDDCLILTRKSPKEELRCQDRKLELVDHGKQFPRFKVFCSARGFWPFAKERLIKYHGVPLDKLPYYIEEMSFRWMNRGAPLFDLILERLCRYTSEFKLQGMPSAPTPEHNSSNYYAQKQ
jgi:transposase